MSTGTNQHGMFGEKKGETRVVYAAKKAASVAGVGQHNSENEYLLDSGSQWRPIKIQKTSDGKTLIYVEQV